MKLLNLSTFLTVLLLIFSGCVGTSPKPSDSPIIDKTLPIVELTPLGVFSDMKAIAFEWSSIQDPRVEGVYIYKKDMNAEDSEYEFYDTVKNRFVTHYIDEDVEPQSAYAYYFKTFTKTSESKQSKQAKVRTLPILDSVSWIHVIQDMPRSAKLIWRPHTNQIVHKYVIERKTLEEDKWTEIETITGRLQAEFIDAKLKDDFVYKYRVKVITYNGITSKPSKEVKVITKALPLLVTGIRATNNLAKKIRVRWNKTNTQDFSHYNIYRAESVDGSYKHIKSMKDTSFVDAFNEDGKDYFYKVSGVDIDGLEGKYDVALAHGQTLSKPSIPSMVELAMVGNKLEVSWQSTDPRVKSYIVNKTKKKSWLSSVSEEFVGIRGTRFIDNAIEPETTYLYEVYSVDEFDIKSDPSIEVKYTTAKRQGSISRPEDVQQTPQTRAIETDNKNVIKPMEDFGMSFL